MVLKGIFLATVCTVLLASSGLLPADEYRADEYFGLDLSKAALSPRPLGPAAEFARVPLEAKTDGDSEGVQANAEPKAAVDVRQTRMKDSDFAKSHFGLLRLARLCARHNSGIANDSAVKNKLAQSRGNPLDAQAFDTRIQVWPCRSGGICNWKR